MRRFAAFMLFAIGCIVLVAVASYWRAVVSGPRLHAAYLVEKRGRVIDAQTQRGIEGALVVATWHWTYASLHTSRACLYQKVVTTDAAGGYVVPDVSDKVSVTQYVLPQMLGLAHASYRWEMVVYKPGFMDEADALARAEPKSAVPYYRGAWVMNERATPVRDRHVDVPDIALRDVPLSPEETLLYDRNLVAAATCGFEGRGDDPAYKAWQRALADTATRVPCELPADKLLSKDVLYTIEFLRDDLQEPMSYAQRAAVAGAPRERRLHALYSSESPVRAAQMCEALAGNPATDPRSVP